MGKTMDRMRKAAAEATDVAGRTAEKLVTKGKNKAQVYALQGRMAKMQRQLGALVYSQYKTGRDDEEMRRWYYDEIDRIKAQLARRTSPYKDDVDVTVYPSKTPDDMEQETPGAFAGQGSESDSTAAPAGEEGAKGAMFCSDGGQQLAQEPGESVDNGAE